jgi:hypothetical protein
MRLYGGQPPKRCPKCEQATFRWQTRLRRWRCANVSCQHVSKPAPQVPARGGTTDELTADERTVHSLITIKAWTGLPRRDRKPLKCCMPGRHEGPVQRHHEIRRADLFRQLVSEKRLGLKPTDPIQNVLEALKLHRHQLKGVPTISVCKRHERELKKR